MIIFIIADISVLLRHSSISITESRYVNKNKDYVSRALSAFDEIIN